jgi:acetyl-CoA C-acetyltransferase
VVEARTPVVVGVGQVSQRMAPASAREPIELLADACRAAEADAGARRALLPDVDVVAVVHIASWPYADPGAFLARRLGITPNATAMSTVGGNSPQLLVNEFANRMQRGELDVALIGGAECIYTRWRARREPRTELTWKSGDDAPCKWVIGDDRPGSSEYEAAHLAVAPTLVYPLFETALRADAGRTIDEHQRHVSELWAPFSEVAAANPYAWSRVAFTPEEIRTVTAENRMVAFPYPKRMCSNIDVDQGAALLLCTYEHARSAGVPDDRIVFLHAGSSAHDHWFVTERHSLTASPAMHATFTAVLQAAGIGVDDVARFDLYSCFPSAVQLALGALGLDGNGRDHRRLTVTGGLGFAGGPVNNYPTHAIASMVNALRADPGSIGLTTALGWYATKHAAGVWSTTPPQNGFGRVDERTTQAKVDATPRRQPAGLIDGDAVIEATSVAVERDGTPSTAIVTAFTSGGRRALANTRNADVMHSMMREPWEGRSVRVVNDGLTNQVVA